MSDWPMTQSEVLPALMNAARTGESFMLYGRLYVAAEALPTEQAVIAEQKWRLVGAEAALERIRRLCVGEAYGIVSKGEILRAM